MTCCPRLVGVVIAEEALLARLRRTRRRRPPPRRLRGCAVDGLVLQHLAVVVGEDGDRHAPGALARQHPVGPLLDHGAQAVLAGGRHEARGVDGRKRAGAQRRAVAELLVHVDEPLRRVAEDDRLLRAPGMRIAVLQPAAREQHVALDQRLDDGLVGVALLAVVVDDARRAALAVRAEARRVLGEEAGIVDGEGDVGVDARACAARGAASIQASKSSRPWPGAVWTKPVPASSVT